MATPIISFTLVDRPKSVSIRAWRRAMKEGHQLQGVFWQREFSDRHFRRNAASRYGYARRSRRYQLRKRAMRRNGAIAGSGPLVFTGAARRAAQLAAITGTPSRTRIQKQMPSYFSIRRRGRGPDLVREMFAVNNTEGHKLTDVLSRHAHRRSEQLGRSGRRRTKIG